MTCDDRRYNAVTDMVDRNVEEGLGDATAFIDPDRTLTYGQLQAESRRMVNLLGELGIRREERIAILMHDTVDWPVVFWGAVRAGVVPACLNTLLPGDQYAYLLGDSRAQALFISAALLPVVEPILGQLDGLRHVVVIDGTDHGYLDFRTLMASAPAEAGNAATCADEPAFWLYSSGSTGAPKGVRHVHSSPAYVARNYGRGVLGIRPDDLCFSAAKLFFAYGFGASMAVPMSVGAKSVLLPGRPTPASVLETMHAHDPTIFFGVPTLYAATLADPACRPENGSKRLRLCISAGEPLPEDVGLSWKRRMGIDIIDGIGSTEMLHVFLSNRPGEVRYGTTGREIPGYELKLATETGAEAAPGEIGELLVSGGSAADGYWNQRAKSRATFLGEWVRTGDKYIRDEAGYYHYCGRTDDMMKVSGRWLSPFEVEQALVAHPAVLEAAVVAKEDEAGLVKPKAFVVLTGDAPGDDLFETLKAHVKEAIGPWKYPRWIEIVDDLPKTATGKIQRFRLRG